MRKTGKAIWWFLSVFCFLGAIAYFPSFASLLLFIAAILQVPIPFIKDKLAEINLTGVKSFILALILFFGGALAAPSPNSHSSSSTNEVVSADISDSAFMEKARSADLIAAPISEDEYISSEPATTPAQKPISELTPKPTPEPTPAPTPEPTPDPTPEPTVGITYILNTNTLKFHYPDCKSVKQMKESNKQEYTGSRDELISRGYSPCGNCHP